MILIFSGEDLFEKDSDAYDGNTGSCVAIYISGTRKE